MNKPSYKKGNILVSIGFLVGLTSRIFIVLGESDSLSGAYLPSVTQYLSALSILSLISGIILLWGCVLVLKSKNRHWAWLTLVIVFNLIGLGVIYSLKDKSGLDINANKSSPLNTYISKARESGTSDEDIKKQLLSSGWQESDVDIALKGDVSASSIDVAQGQSNLKKGRNWNVLIFAVVFPGLVTLAVAFFIVLSLPADDVASPDTAQTPSSSPQSNNQDVQLNDEPYVDPNGFFSIRIPVGWEQRENDHGLIYFTTTEYKVEVATLVPESQPNNDWSLEGFIDNFEKIYEESIISQEKITIEGIPAVLIEYDENSDNKGFSRTLLFAFMHEGGVYTAYTIVPTEFFWDLHKEEMRKSLLTLKPLK